jgi:hypothetical protein
MKPSRLAAFRRQHGTRVLVAVALLASLGFLSHSVTRLLRAQREAQSVNVNMQRLNREIEVMGRELNTTNAPQAFEALRHEEQRLLVSQLDLTNWTGQLRQQGIPLVFDLDTQTGSPATNHLAEQRVQTIPVTVELVPAKGIIAVKPTYQRLLQFLQSIAEQTPRVDLVELRVSAESGAIDQATAVLHVWVGEPAPAIAATTPPKTEAQP